MPAKQSALDIIKPLLEDPDVMEIMIDGPERVSVEKGGRIQDTDIRLGSNEVVKKVIEAALQMTGQKLEEGKTVYEVRFLDNSRMIAVLSPTAINGHSVIFRKWMTRQLTWDTLIDYGSVTPEYQNLMQSAVNAGISILIAGGTNSGKTTIMNRVAELISSEKRIIAVEEAHFYQFTHPRAIYLEVDDTENMTMNELLTTASRMRPDWLVVGELEGAEAMHTMQLFSTGYSGMTTMHATSVENALTRLESMCLMANLGLGMDDIRQVIASALRLIAYQERLPDGKRKVTQVSELKGLEDGRYILQPLMRFDDEKETLKLTGTKPSWE